MISFLTLNLAPHTSHLTPHTSHLPPPGALRTSRGLMLCNVRNIRQMPVAPAPSSRAASVLQHADLCLSGCLFCICVLQLQPHGQVPVVARAAIPVDGKLGRSKQDMFLTSCEVGGGGGSTADENMRDWVTAVSGCDVWCGEGGLSNEA